MQPPYTPQTILVQRLLRQQHLAGWSSRRMAAELGISKSLWRHTCRGEMPVGLALLRATARRYPELAGDILATLLAGNRLDEREVS
jgi:hypothetical protein